MKQLPFDLKIDEKEKIKAFNRKEFIDFLIDNGLVSLEPHAMHNGIVTPYYIDFRGFSDNKIIDAMVDHVYVFSRNHFFLEVDSYIGVPEGMTSLGISLSRKYGKKVVIARSKEKTIADSFQKKWFVGLNEGDKVIVVEDVIQTGDMTYDLISKIKEAGANVVGAVALVDRRERPFKNSEYGFDIKKENPYNKSIEVNYYSAADIIRQNLKVNLHSLVDIHYILSRYNERFPLNEQKKKEIEDFYLEHGADINILKNAYSPEEHAIIDIASSKLTETLEGKVANVVLRKQPLAKDEDFEGIEGKE